MTADDRERLAEAIIQANPILPSWRRATMREARQLADVLLAQNVHISDGGGVERRERPIPDTVRRPSSLGDAPDAPTATPSARSVPEPHETTGTLSVPDVPEVPAPLTGAQVEWLVGLRNIGPGPRIAIKSLLAREAALTARCAELEAGAWLNAEDCGWFFVADDGRVQFQVNANDLFGWATAHAVDVPHGELAKLGEIAQEYGVDGIHAWACNEEGADPLPEMAADEKAKVARIRRWLYNAKREAENRTLRGEPDDE